MRLAGQDTRRGTFSQRHGVLVDTNTEQEYFPLAHIARTRRRSCSTTRCSPEYAALGFEYGYSVADPQAWVGWEAQFGDFMNGAQIIIDQFIVAAEDKWGQTSGLTMLLPHGFEGQGPEHSSARIERFLALCAEDNLRVVYPTTAAQYFHVLRRQSRALTRKPLICFTPKRYLRMPQTRSHVDDLTTGAFRETLDDPSTELDPASVRRVLLCSGKLGHELIGRRDELGRRSPSCASSSSIRGPRSSSSRSSTATRPRPGVVGAGGAGEHGRLELRPRPAAPHPAGSRRAAPHRPAHEPEPGEREPHRARARAGAASRRRVRGLAS